MARGGEDRLCGVGKVIIAFTALSSFLLCGATSPSGCPSGGFSIGPSKGEVVGVAVGVGAAIAVGTIVLVEVHKSHHTIKGCVTAGPNSAADGINLVPDILPKDAPAIISI